MVFDKLSKEELIKLLKPYYRECKLNSEPFVAGEFYKVSDFRVFSEVETNDGKFIQLENKEIAKRFK